jgi:hypothetical protein
MPVFGPIGTLSCSGTGCGCGGGTPLYPCLVGLAQCGIPEQNLTISWVTGVGNGSATLIYNSAGPTWSVSCVGPTIGLLVNSFVYTLSCSSGHLAFSARSYQIGGCPSGTFWYECDYITTPAQISLTSVTCGANPTLVFTANNPACALLSGLGTAVWTITL